MVRRGQLSLRRLRVKLTKPPAATDTRDQSGLAMLGGAGGPMGPGQPDMVKVFKSEIENLSLADGLYRWVGDGVEDRVLERWGKK